MHDIIIMKGGKMISFKYKDIYNKFIDSYKKIHIDPSINYSSRNKDDFLKTKTDEILKPHIFKPDIYVEQSRENFIKGNDTILDYAINYCKELN